MSQLLSLQLSRTRALIVAGCLVVAGISLFAAGTIAGLLMASSSVKELSASLEEAKASLAALPANKSNVPAAESSSAAPAGTVLNPASANSDSTATVAPVNPTLVSAAPASGLTSQQQTASAAPGSPAVAAPASNAARDPSGTGGGLSAALPAAETNYTIPLAVKVCSFTGKASAENMIAALAAKGYHASLGHFAGAGGRSWYVVKLGPYTEWDTASNVASRVAIAENVRPEIGPMR